ncbi:hypothetical protein BJX70DRAFT_381159 [Aspergillus crustosus]
MPLLMFPVETCPPVSEHLEPWPARPRLLESEMQSAIFNGHHLIVSLNGNAVFLSFARAGDNYHRHLHDRSGLAGRLGTTLMTVQTLSPFGIADSILARIVQFEKILDR